MYLSALFLIYIAAAFLALLGIGIVLLLISREKNRQSRQYRVVMCFAVVVFVNRVLYLYFYYRDMILGNEAVNVFLRIIDYCLCGSIFFFWLNVMDVLDDVKHRFRRTWAYILGALIALPGTVATAFFMDEYYFFGSDEKLPAGSSDQQGTIYLMATDGSETEDPQFEGLVQQRCRRKSIHYYRDINGSPDSPCDFQIRP